MAGELYGSLRYIERIVCPPWQPQLPTPAHPSPSRRPPSGAPPSRRPMFVRARDRYRGRAPCRRMAWRAASRVRVGAADRAGAHPQHLLVAARDHLSAGGGSPGSHAGADIAASARCFGALAAAAAADDMPGRTGRRVLPIPCCPGAGPLPSLIAETRHRPTPSALWVIGRPSRRRPHGRDLRSRGSRSSPTDAELWHSKKIDTSPATLIAIGVAAPLSCGARSGHRRRRRPPAAPDRTVVRPGFGAAMANLGTGRVVSGANDNGTGVADSVALAEALGREAARRERPRAAPLDLGGGDLEGMQAFARRHFAALPGSSDLLPERGHRRLAAICFQLRRRGLVRYEESTPPESLALVDGPPPRSSASTSSPTCACATRPTGSVSLFAGLPVHLVARSCRRGSKTALGYQLAERVCRGTSTSAPSPTPSASARRSCAGSTATGCEAQGRRALAIVHQPDAGPGVLADAGQRPGRRARPVAAS